PTVSGLRTICSTISRRRSRTATSRSRQASRSPGSGTNSTALVRASPCCRPARPHDDHCADCFRKPAGPTAGLLHFPPGPCPSPEERLSSLYATSATGVSKRHNPKRFLQLSRRLNSHFHLGLARPLRIFSLWHRVCSF